MPKPIKPRIIIEHSEAFCRWIFVVRFPTQGWRTRRCLSWSEALFAAGLIPEKEVNA